MIYVIRNGVLLPTANLSKYPSVIPTGTVIWFPSNSIPFGWLLCDGSSYNTDTYSDLYEILESDKLPDFREVSLVGIGERADGLEHDVFSLLEFKDESLGAHYHNWPNTWGLTGGSRGYGSSSASGGWLVPNGTPPERVSNDNVVLNTGGSNTRQKSVGLNVLIKW